MFEVLAVCIFSTLCLLPVSVTAESVAGVHAQANDEVSLLQAQVEMKRSEATDVETTMVDSDASQAGLSSSTTAMCTQRQPPTTFQAAFPASESIEKASAPTDVVRAEESIVSQTDEELKVASQQAPISALSIALQVVACLLVVDVLRRHSKKERASSKESGCSSDISKLLVAALAGDEIAFDAEFAGAGGVNFQHVDNLGCSALHYAAKGVSAQIVRSLLAVDDIRVDASDSWDETPLHVAARAGHVEVCKALLDAGACIDATNAEMYTPLVVAGQAEQALLCRCLVERGAGVAGLSERLPSIVDELLAKELAA